MDLLEHLTATLGLLGMDGAEASPPELFLGAGPRGVTGGVGTGLGPLGKGEWGMSRRPMGSLGHPAPGGGS